jgi:hypothetical protein
MPAGRPSESVPQHKANEIVDWISEGKPLREFCRIDGNPAFRTVYDWLAKDAEFSARFAQARESGEDVLAQECLEISEENPQVEIPTKCGSYIATDGAGIQRNRLRVDTRLKLLAKWNPKKYGDKQAIEHSGELNVTLAERVKAAEKRIAE